MTGKKPGDDESSLELHMEIGFDRSGFVGQPVGGILDVGAHPWFLPSRSILTA